MLEIVYSKVIDLLFHIIMESWKVINSYFMLSLDFWNQNLKHTSQGKVMHAEDVVSEEGFFRKRLTGDTRV